MNWPSKGELEALIPAGVTHDLRAFYLAAWCWSVTVAHLNYDNSGGNRCGEHGFVDCSGGVALAFNIAWAAMGMGPPFVCENTNSYSLARDCVNTARPDWLETMFPGLGLPGTYVPLGAAMDMPGVLGFHGSDFGMGADWNGDGHVKSAYYGHDVSVEAMSHSAGVGFSVFLNGSFIPWAAIHPLLLPCFAPAPAPIVEEDMNIEHFAGYPAQGTQQPIAQLVLADAHFFPHGGVICRNGLRIKGDLLTTNPLTSIWVPKFQTVNGVTGTKWVAMTKKPSGLGVTLLDDASNTTAPDQGFLVDAHGNPIVLAA
jgi:hypothetical protein